MDDSELREKLNGDIEHELGLGDLAGRFGATAKAAAVFGKPIEREGVTVVPVAKVGWGFGGGGGVGDQGNERGGGMGAGGGAGMSPAGFIEITAAGASYKPIHDTAAIAARIASLLGLLALLLLRRRG